MNRIRNTFLTIFLLLSVFSLQAQDSIEMRIKPRATIHEVIPFHKIYLYPAFTQGLVYQKNGAVDTAKLNYNLLLQEMQFLAGDADTLALGEESQVRMVTIQSDTFSFDNGFYQQIFTSNNIRIAKQQDLHVADIQKKGGYDIPHAAGAIDIYNNQFGAAGSNLIANQDVIFASGTRYFFSLNGEPYTSAQKRNILDKFPERHTTEISAFIKEKNINFYNEENLITLGKFLSTLD